MRFNRILLGVAVSMSIGTPYSAASHAPSFDAAKRVEASVVTAAYSNAQSFNLRTATQSVSSVEAAGDQEAGCAALLKSRTNSATIDAANQLLDCGAYYQDQRLFIPAINALSRAAAAYSQLDGQQPQAVLADLRLGQVYADAHEFARGELTAATATKRLIALRSHVTAPDQVTELNWAIVKALLITAEISDEAADVGAAELECDQLLNLAPQANLSNEDWGNSRAGCADAYAAAGREDRAEPLYRQAIASLRSASSPELSITINNLAVMYVYSGRLADAQETLKQVVTLDSGTKGETLAIDLDNLAVVEAAQKHYQDAVKTLELARSYEDSDPHATLQGRVTIYNSLADAYAATGQNDAALKIYRDVLPLNRELVQGGPDVPMVFWSRLADNYYALGLMDNARAAYRTAFARFKIQLRNDFTFMSEQDRLAFVKVARDLFGSYASFCYTNLTAHPELADQLYDIALQQKALVAYSVTALRAHIREHGSAEILGEFDELVALRTEVAAQRSAALAGTEVSSEEMTTATNRANALEEELTRNAADFARVRALSDAGWTDVRGRLGPHQWAIEIYRLHYFDGRSGLGPNIYLAIAMNSSSTRPEVIRLGLGDWIEGAAFDDYQVEVGLTTGGAKAKHLMYGTIWQPILRAIGKGSTAFLSPDGIFNQVALGVLAGPSGAIALDQLDLRIVSSTRDLVDRSASNSRRSPSIIMGGASYQMSLAVERTAAGVARKPPLWSCLGEPATASPNQSQTLAPLRYSGAEAQAITATFKQAKEPAACYLGVYVLKPIILTAASPWVLHIATHGYYYADLPRDWEARYGSFSTGSSDDPMLRAGIYLAGGSRTVNGPYRADLDDGVLTAYDVSLLDLSGTELVAISACDSGRGDVRYGEGVFSMRRALEEAGSKSSLLALWDVDDASTKELMQRFYRDWLFDRLGEQAAFRKAQRELRSLVTQDRAKYPKPPAFYFGAFVLAGAE